MVWLVLGGAIIAYGVMVKEQGEKLTNLCRGSLSLRWGFFMFLQVAAK